MVISSILSLGRGPGPGGCDCSWVKVFRRFWISSWGWRCSQPQWVTLFHHFVSTMSIHSPLISLDPTLSFSSPPFALPLTSAPLLRLVWQRPSRLILIFLVGYIYNCSPVALPPLLKPVLLHLWCWQVSSLFLWYFRLVLRTNLLTLIEMSVFRLIPNLLQGTRTKVSVQQTFSLLPVLHPLLLHKGMRNIPDPRRARFRIFIISLHLQITLI